jgi:hypothetical protein
MKIVHRLVQPVWLSALVILDDRTLYADYRRRFTVPMETFRHDVKKLRRAFRTIGAVLHGNFRRYLYLRDSHLE